MHIQRMCVDAIIRFTTIACDIKIVTKALKVSLIVGTILNLINQGDNLFTLNFEQLNSFKLFLTYSVPYLVTTYTAVSLKLEFNIGRHAAIESDLECKNCANTLHVKEADIIPECPKCGVTTRWKAIN